MVSSATSQCLIPPDAIRISESSLARHGIAIEQATNRWPILVGSADRVQAVLQESAIDGSILSGMSPSLAHAAMQTEAALATNGTGIGAVSLAELIAPELANATTTDPFALGAEALVLVHASADASADESIAECPSDMIADGSQSFGMSSMGNCSLAFSSAVSSSPVVQMNSGLGRLAFVLPATGQAPVRVFEGTSSEAGSLDASVPDAAFVASASLEPLISEQQLVQCTVGGPRVDSIATLVGRSQLSDRRSSLQPLSIRSSLGAASLRLSLFGRSPAIQSVAPLGDALNAALEVGFLGAGGSIVATAAYAETSSATLQQSQLCADAIDVVEVQMLEIGTESALASAYASGALAGDMQLQATCDDATIAKSSPLVANASNEDIAFAAGEVLAQCGIAGDLLPFVSVSESYESSILASWVLQWPPNSANMPQLHFAIGDGCSPDSCAPISV